MDDISAGAVAAMDFERAGEKLSAARAAIGQVFIGQDKVVDEVMATLLAGGHGLIIGVPGLGKTLLVETVATVFGLATRRAQFTPDLMPADILGSEVLEEGDDGRRAFRFIKGPVFCQLLMADEINRASPRTQSALLQAMQERNVAVGGINRPLPQPFHVLATQNPIEQEGAYPLPEAQLDRFLMEIRVDFPTLETERRILSATTGSESATAPQTMSDRDLMEAQASVRAMPIGEGVIEGILRLVRAARPDAPDSPLPAGAVAWGPGPRASQALSLAARAKALLDGRLSPSLDDVVALAPAVLRHRMALSYAAEVDAGLDIDEAIARLITVIA
ncbi:MAG: AAA family ATPase [Alphaproteobacteria bacterium]